MRAQGGLSPEGLGAACDLLCEQEWGAKGRGREEGGGQARELRSLLKKGWVLVPWMGPWASHLLEGADTAKRSKGGILGATG